MAERATVAGGGGGVAAATVVVATAAAVVAARAVARVADLCGGAHELVVQVDGVRCATPPDVL